MAIVFERNREQKTSEYDCLINGKLKFKLINSFRKHWIVLEKVGAGWKVIWSEQYLVDAKKYCINRYHINMKGGVIAKLKGL